MILEIDGSLEPDKHDTVNNGRVHTGLKSSLSSEVVNGKITNGTSKINGHAISGENIPGARSTMAGFSAESITSSNDIRNGHTRNEKSAFTPIAICGMACRLPGGIASPQELWDFLIAKGDARCRVPETRYNIDGYHSQGEKSFGIRTEYGYFLDESVDLGALDTSFFSLTKAEVERTDPQQKILLEVARECLDDAGEINWRGKDIGVYVGTYGNDWYDAFNREAQQYGVYQIATTHDFALSNRLSYEMDLQGPSMTIRTACSSGLIGLNEACSAIAKGDCTSAIVGGANIILAPSLTTAMSQQGALGVDGSCKTFSAKANGYARGEAIIAFYLKSLPDAIRDGSPVRGVIVGSATNSDGRTPGFSVPSSAAQEKLIRHTYKVAGISEAEIGKTGFFECHGTGTPVGDPIEAGAVARVFGNLGGVHIGSIKPNLGHSEGASGLTSVMKAVLALENRTIPPNIKALPLTDKIPFESAHLTVPVEATHWPEGRNERVSVNSFGIGGANAHVIIDSAASFNIVHATKTAKLDAPQLLLHSANSQQSLKEMTARYQKFISEASNSFDITDLAYTLANRREHLPHRSFVVRTKDRAGIVSAPAAPKKAPSTIMVFTGQGSQWPQMGRELLRTHAIFRQSIKSLDSFLEKASKGSTGWKIEDELLKPASKSRVNEAEFSQPLCTAVQIALIDAFTAVGVKPAAVVGHSSGEIAAAYAAGGLTAEEAITVAFHRGLVTKLQKRRGAMAAVGFSWEEAEEHIVPGVVIACDNSPSSVTLSGDADQLQAIVATVKQNRPEVPATILKVEKAYHSHHMVEVGEDYCRAMEESLVVGEVPTIPFFSSVTGELYTAELSETPFGPKYWQRNLESPVLFKGAVAKILRHSSFTNPVFVEMGPHAALAGPLRQIITFESSTAPYVLTLVRRQNSVEDLLNSIGKLWALNVNIDLKSLMPNGRCLPDLPRYPWNHSQSYMWESRVSKEWRQNKHRFHDLLGVKTPESSEIEPTWRNLFNLDNAPWIRDHKIEEDVVFPFAGYIAMAAEAVRQASGIQEGVELRNVIVNSALVVSESSPTELVTSLRRYRLTNSEDSQWWEFTVMSYNGHIWMKHCSGQVRAEPDTFLGKGDILPEAPLPRQVNVRRWYERVRRGGIAYGYHFRTLEDLRTTTCGEGLATTNMRNNWHGDEANYHLHPIVLDTYFQLLLSAAQHASTYEYRQLIPTSVASLRFTRCSDDRLSLFSDSQLVGEQIHGGGSCFAGSKTVLKVSGVRLSTLESSEATIKNGVPMTARVEMVPHIDFQPLSSLVKSVHDHTTCMEQLDMLTELAVSLAKRSLSAATASIETPHLKRYRMWLDLQTDPFSEYLDAATLVNRIGSFVSLLSGTPNEHAAVAIARVCSNIEDILLGKRKSFEILNSDGTLDKLYTFLEEYNASEFFSNMANSKPNLRVLELGAGAGVHTAGILKSLTRADGQVMYSQYACTDASAGAMEIAQKTFKNIPNIEFTTLNISEDPTNQGFEGRQFDLIIAAGVMHGTPSLHVSLKHVRKLLAQDGRLLIQQPLPGLSWTKYIFGTLPGWWCGVEDQRPDEPYATLDRWNNELLAAGFQDLKEVVPDSVKLPHISNVMVAKPQRETIPSQKVTLLYSSSQAFDLSSVAEELKAQGYEVFPRTFGDVLPPDQDVIVLIDRENPFFDGMDSASFELLKTFVADLSSLGIGALWVTRPSQTHCLDPRYAPAIGFGRAVRNELAVDFATCETDDFDSVGGAKKVIDVFRKFQQRDQNDVLGPDYEYAIDNGVVRVNRIFPCPLEIEHQDIELPKEAILRIGNLGRLETLHWSEQPARILENDDVEIEVHASGLNFRDILLGMGIVGAPGRQVTFGNEATGIVRHIGPSVTKLKVGDRVVVIDSSALSTTVTTTELLCEKLHDDISFIDGATMPLVYVTAIYSLFNIGRLEKGQSILIHSGCGGVGIAAIQLARMVGAEIYTTVSSEEKAAFLMEMFAIPRHRIFNSRSTSFADDLMRETKGEGVDLALNSLAGELLHATWRCIAKWGMMVEIGKRDLLGAGKLDMDVFLANRSYCCVDISQMVRERPHVIGRILHTMMDYHRQGHIQSIHLAKVASASAVQDTFRWMQQGKHIGKIVFSIRDADSKLELDQVSSPDKTKVKLDPTASYLLIGGLGGLGRVVSVWMAAHGARNLTYLSRSAGSGKHDAEFAREMQSLGCSVQFVSGSVTEAADVSRAIDGMPSPLKGIVQMSMVLRDQAFPRMTIEEWKGAVEPKIRGTWLLHQITSARGIDLDFLVLFSSLSGIVGQPGQANYAAANTFLDAFVKYRNSMSLPCTAIDIGAMEGVGYLFDNEELLKKMQGTGWHSVTEEELLEALAVAMLPRAVEKQDGSGTVTSIVKDKSNILLGMAPTAPLSSDNSSARLRRDIRMAVYHNIGGGDMTEGDNSNDSLRAFLKSARANPSIYRTSETAALLANEVGKKLFMLLLKPDQEVDTSLSLVEVGLDSLIAVEMRAWWKQVFGLDISVLEMLSMGTLKELGKKVAEDLAGAHGG